MEEFKGEKMTSADCAIQYSPKYVEWLEERVKVLNLYVLESRRKEAEYLKKQSETQYYFDTDGLSYPEEHDG